MYLTVRYYRNLKNQGRQRDDDSQTNFFKYIIVEKSCVACLTLVLVTDVHLVLVKV